MKKRFIFDESYIKRYAKKDKLKWLIMGLSALVLIVIIIIVILATRNNEPTTIEPAVPAYQVKEELTIESGSDLPEVTDYFDVLENIDIDEIQIIYPDEFELSYDTSYCSEEEIAEIYSEEIPNFADQECVEPYLATPATYGITIILQEEEYTVTLNVVDTAPPILTTTNVEIYEGDTYELIDFVYACYDVTSECDLAYYTEDTDEDGNQVDYANITEPGEYTVRIIASDNYGNVTDPVSATLTIIEVEGSLYTVTFDANGGSEIRSRKVGENGQVIQPDDPVRDGYVFVGWYLDGEEFDFNTGITSNITLIAQWEEIEEESSEGNSGGNSGSSYVNVSSISLNYLTIYLEVGESKTVTARVTPSNATNQTVTWSSSNTSIATVSNGSITGVSTGTTTITATAGGKSASVQVVVRETSSGTTCTYGNTTYNSSYILSVDLTRNNCAIDPNSNPSETLSITDYSKLVSDLQALGFSVGSNFSHRVTLTKIKNTSGTGLVGYQITINVSIYDTANPYVPLTATYILRSDGTRVFQGINNICKNSVCLS